MFWRGEGWKVTAAHNSKSIKDNEMKSGGVVESQKLINLVQFNWYMTSLLRHNDVITVNCQSSYKNLANQSRKV